MRIHVGSKNQMKIDAVRETFADYPLFAGAEIVGVDVPVEEFGHPKSLEETMRGACERAEAAHAGADYGVGIEGGLIAVSGAETQYVETTACVVFDGTRRYVGFSPGYEWPKRVLNLILGGLDGSQALRAVGWTDHPKIGTAQGGIWLLTDGRLNRKEFMKQGLMMALVRLEHPEHD